MRFIDLCCGIGGFHQALKSLGFECVMASDIDKECRRNYLENYGIEPRGDFTRLDISSIPAFDILCAGFPCQPFSKAGDRKGFNDARGNLFFDICRIIDYHKPAYILLENVRNLATHDHGNTWAVIKDTLVELNYHIYEKPLILNTLFFGIPQNRERVVILCKRRDLGPLPALPKMPKKKCAGLESILEDVVDDKYRLTGKLKIAEAVWQEFIDLCRANQITIPRFPLWTDWWDRDTVDNPKYQNWIDKNRAFYAQSPHIWDAWLKKARAQPLWVGAMRKMEWQVSSSNLNMNEVLWTARGSGIRIKKTDYSPTLVAMSMIPIYGPQSRMLTPRECARLQSFPEDYIIHSNEKIAYRQFGNAVNVKMIEQCARFLICGEPLFP